MLGKCELCGCDNFLGKIKVVFSDGKKTTITICDNCLDIIDEFVWNLQRIYKETK